MIGSLASQLDQPCELGLGEFAFLSNIRVNFYVSFLSIGLDFLSDFEADKLRNLPKSECDTSIIRVGASNYNLSVIQ